MWKIAKKIAGKKYYILATIVLAIFIVVVYYESISSKRDTQFNNLKDYNFIEGNSAILYDGLTAIKTTASQIPDELQTDLTEVISKFNVSDTRFVLLSKYKFKSFESCCFVLIADNNNNLKSEVAIISSADSFFVVQDSNKPLFLIKSTGVDVGIGLTKYVFYVVSDWDFIPVLQVETENNSGIYDKTQSQYLQEEVSFSYENNGDYANIIENRVVKSKKEEKSYKVVHKFNIITNKYD